MRIGDVFLQKCAFDAGFDIPPEWVGEGAGVGAPGWWLCRSCRFGLRMWLRAEAAGGAVVALSEADVARRLGEERAVWRDGAVAAGGGGLPAGAVAGVAVRDADSLHALAGRAAALGWALPHRLAADFGRETVGMSDETEAERWAVRRIGQEKLRAGVVAFWGGRCAVTGVGVVEVLRASHIKPWRDCVDARERLNVYNALLLAPQVDAVFDRGLASFGDDGRILLSGRLSEADLRGLGLAAGMRLRSVAAGHLPFLAYHRDFVFSRSK